MAGASSGSQGLSLLGIDKLSTMIMLGEFSDPKTISSAHMNDDSWRAIVPDPLPFMSATKGELSPDDVNSAILALWLATQEIEYPYQISLGPAKAFQLRLQRDSGQLMIPKSSDSALFPITVKGLKNRMFLIACEPANEHMDGKLRAILLAGTASYAEKEALLAQIARAINCARWSIPTDPGFHLSLPEALDDWTNETRLSFRAEKCLVLLNAWAYILDIPIKPGSFRTNIIYPNTGKFVIHIEKCARLVAKGQAGFKLIECLLRDTGYAYSSEESVGRSCIRDRKYQTSLRQLCAVAVAKPEPTTWAERLEQELQRWEAELPPSKRDPSPESLVYGRPATIDQVVVSIGAFWMAEWKDGVSATSYGRTDVFEKLPTIQNHATTSFLDTDEARKNPFAQGLWHQSSKLLLAAGSIPQSPRMLIPCQIQTKSESGDEQATSTAAPHFFLASAELDDEDDEDDDEDGVERAINVNFYDSAWGTSSWKGMKQRVRRIVDGSGWLGWKVEDDPSHLERPTVSTSDELKMEYIEYKAKYVPQQSEPWSSGVYTILNGWCKLLGMPFTQDKRRVGDAVDQSEQAFLEQAIRMINLAQHGYLDCRAMHAFVEAYGYVSQRSKYQSIRERPWRAGEASSGGLETKVELWIKGQWKKRSEYAPE